MRLQLSHTAFFLGLLAAGAAGATTKPPSETPSLTLYERADFSGRHAVFHASAETARQAFTAHSAKSTGLWTLCEGRDPASKCQTVNGPAAKLKIEPAIVRPGVAAVALYEKPGLQGRRVIYSFGSDIPPPFKARSARTWGGAWSLCDAGGKCQVVDSERPVAVVEHHRQGLAVLAGVGHAPDLRWRRLGPGRLGRANFGRRLQFRGRGSLPRRDRHIHIGALGRLG